MRSSGVTICNVSATNRSGVLYSNADKILGHMFSIQVSFRALLCRNELALPLIRALALSSPGGSDILGRDGSNIGQIAAVPRRAAQCERGAGPTATWSGRARRSAATIIFSRRVISSRVLKRLRWCWAQVQGICYRDARSTLGSGVALNTRPVLIRGCSVNVYVTSELGLAPASAFRLRQS